MMYRCYINIWLDNWMTNECLTPYYTEICETIFALQLRYACVTSLYWPGNLISGAGKTALYDCGLFCRWTKLVCPFVFSLKLLSNHNNWSRRSSGANKGSSVCLWQERLRETLLSIQIIVMCWFSATEGTTVWYTTVCCTCVWITCRPTFSLPTVCGSWCLHVHVRVVFKPLPLYSHTCRLLSDIKPWLFFLLLFFSLLVLHYAASVHEWSICLDFSFGFPLFTVTLVLLSVSWPGHAASFFSP